MVDVLGSRVVGPLESYAPSFAAGLSRQGYTVSGASQHLCFIGHLSRWMLAGERDVSALSLKSSMSTSQLVVAPVT